MKTKTKHPPQDRFPILEELTPNRLTPEEAKSFLESGFYGDDFASELQLTQHFQPELVTEIVGKIHAAMMHFFRSRTNSVMIVFEGGCLREFKIQVNPPMLENSGYLSLTAEGRCGEVDLRLTLPDAESLKAALNALPGTLENDGVASSSLYLEEREGAFDGGPLAWAVKPASKESRGRVELRFTQGDAVAILLLNLVDLQFLSNRINSIVPLYRAWLLEGSRS